MLATEKINGAFQAIIEEVEQLETEEMSEVTRQKLAIIRSIAKHQSDIRKAEQGSCRAHKKPGE